MSAEYSSGVTRSVVTDEPVLDDDVIGVIVGSLLGAHASTPPILTGKTIGKTKSAEYMWGFFFNFT